MKHHLLAALTILAGVPAIAKQDASPMDAAQLQGTWEVTALEAAGEQAPEGSFKGKKVLIEGEKISLTGKPEDLRPYRMDAAASPKAMDISGSGESDFNKGFAKAIFELDDDVLKLCFSQVAELERPSGFNTAGSKYMCFTLKRLKH